MSARRRMRRASVAQAVQGAHRLRPSPPGLLAGGRLAASRLGYGGGVAAGGAVVGEQDRAAVALDRGLADALDMFQVVGLLERAVRLAPGHDGLGAGRADPVEQIGRASCRERVWSSVVAASV